MTSQSANLCTLPPDVGAHGTILDDLGIVTPQERVCAYIETTLSHIIEEIQTRPCGRPSITLKRIRDVKTSVDPASQQVERQIVDREVTYGFPGKNKHEAWRFG